MLRRGLVLDLSVAFGKFFFVSLTTRDLERNKTIGTRNADSFFFLLQGLGSAAGYLWWYGM
jgi:hypothetical protein